MLEIYDCIEEGRLVEIGPEERREIEFAISDLPEEEIADTLLAASSDEEIGVGHRSSVKILSDSRFRDILRLADIGGDIASDTFDGIDDLPASRIAEAEVKVKTLTLGSILATLKEILIDIFGEARHITQEIDFHVISLQFGSFLTDRPTYEIHQSVDLLRGTIPIFGREGIKSQILNADIGGEFSDIMDTIDALGMPFATVAATFASPTAVAIHDDGYMRRESRHIDFGEKQVVAIHDDQSL